MRSTSASTTRHDADGILVMIHCRPNTGYAIGHLERLFLAAAAEVTGAEERVWFSYPSLASGLPRNIRLAPDRVLEIDPQQVSGPATEAAAREIRKNGISTVLGFDHQVGMPIHKQLRRAGVKTIISYHGAPMSGLNSGLKLMLKRAQVRLTLSRPDLYIFESEAMRETATHGRGVPSAATRVINLGVDTNTYRPDAALPGYVHKQFGIPSSRKVFVFSGHMEPRKGVHVILQAAVKVAASAQRPDVHFLLLGNQHGDRTRLCPYYQGTPAEEFVTFGGYRNDIPEIFSSCYAGIIASTGWDSFTRSSVEMAASGLPLIVSNLQGLAETLEEGRTGHSFPPGDATELARIITALGSDPAKRETLSVNARKRALNHFTIELQHERLVQAIHHAIESRLR